MKEYLIRTTYFVIIIGDLSLNKARKADTDMRIMAILQTANNTIFLFMSYDDVR